ncbi:hypothetical protein L798_09760 [Zootermopsis nevadensis]|uniref:Uncharacterized protein n=1 Tax=Zootermopsis nevadensis TaxID=136037 RepID=A0A067QZ46_ZOONE|nr:hypothetical protein L798_09760 [Zootermopsis nevadensis]
MHIPLHEPVHICNKAVDWVRWNDAEKLFLRHHYKPTIRTKMKMAVFHFGTQTATDQAGQFYP